jgi:NADH-quinone oxidoreductase subunit M
MFVEFLLVSTFLSALVVLSAPDRYAGKLATVLSLVPLAGVGAMWLLYDASGNALTGGDLAFETQESWFELGQYTVQWYVGVDGVSFPLLVLTVVLVTLALVSSWTPIDERESQFYGLVLLLETALIGVFTALDFFLWFIFWEFVLVPMYVLIAGWGGPRRKYAAIKFLVYTNLGSLVMFTGLFALVLGLGDSLTALSLPEISQQLLAGNLGSLDVDFLGGSVTVDPAALELGAFVLLFLGFAVKVPVVPFHTWLPDAHVEAPTPVSVILAGVLLKMGTYALLRFNFTMLPGVAQDLAAPIVLIGVISVIYGAMLALAQQDLKRIVAYSSISSMGYVLVGLVAFTAHGMGGATFQMISHGLISALLFMAVGVIYNATHTRMVGDMAGLADRMPYTAWIFVAGAFGYMGLPLMSGFAAEVLVFIGAFGSGTIPAAPFFTALAMFGIVIVAGYLLWGMQRSLFGPFRLETDYDIGRAPAHDIVPMLVLLGLIVVLGVNPDLLYEAIQDAVSPLVEGGSDAAGDGLQNAVGALTGGAFR